MGEMNCPVSHELPSEGRRTVSSDGDESAGGTVHTGCLVLPDPRALAEIEAIAKATGSKFDRHMAKRSVSIAHTRDNLQTLDKLTRLVNGQRRIIGDTPLLVPAEEVLPQLVSDRLTDEPHQLTRKYLTQPPNRPPAPSRAVRARPDRPQGGRCRQC